MKTGFGMTAGIGARMAARGMLALVLAWTGLAVAQESAGDNVRASETRSVDARVVRIKLDGAIDLRLRQGDVPSLTINAERRLMPNVTTQQSGDTLHIDADMHGLHFGRGNMRADLVLPSLREISSDGIGSTEVSGFSGNTLELALEGAGSMKVVADYKVIKASLGGVGSLNLWVGDNDSMDLDLRGAGYITLGGRSKSLRASLGGLGGLNAQQCQAEAVNIDLSGLGNATVTALQSATLNLGGLGSVTVYGKPGQRNVSIDGLGKVSWK